MMEIPDVIYLQTGINDEDLGEEGVTWCRDEINDGDTKYLLATPEREAVPELLEALIMLTESSGLVGWIKAQAAIARAASPDDDVADAIMEKE